MKKFITTIQNIWKIKELRDRILFTLGLLMVFRFGSFVVLPGVATGALESNMNQSANDLLGLINVFTGGAFNNASIFALGIMPYITASIIVQLLGFAVPYFQKLQQHEGESGRKKINQITRLLTVAITLVQGGGYLTYISSMGAVSSAISPSVFWLSNIVILSTGTIFTMWLGERITDKGIGNGISLLIMIGIVASLPAALIFEFQAQVGTNGFIIFVLEMIFFFLVVLVTVLLVQGVRKIPIQFAKRAVGRGGATMPAAGNRDYIPLKVIAAGVMPIIFAQALMFLPATIGQFAMGDDGEMAAGGFIRSLTDFTSVPYNVIYFILIVVFTYVYTALIVNPQQYSEYLKRQNAYIPGIKPGKNTADFIDAITSKITLPGSIFLGLIAILPAFAAVFGVNTAFAMFFGGTTLLIMVGVVKSGRIKGRSGMQGIGAGM